jgi:protein-disulfide isomerase
VTGAALIVGLAILLLVVIRPGGSSTPPSTAGLTAPTTEIPAGLAQGRTLGRSDAPVTIDVYVDFQCPFCGQFARLLQPRVVADFVTPGTARIVAHDLAFLSPGRTPDESTEAAVGAACADRQGKFWPFHDYLFWNQNGENKGAFSRDRLAAIGTAVGLDPGSFATCTADPAVRADVAAETAQGESKGISQTPTLFVNGRPFVGLPTYDQLATEIRAAAAGAGASGSIAP